MGRICLVLISLVCCLALSNGADGPKSAFWKWCNQGIAYSHVSGGGVLNYQKLEPYKIKEWELDEKWNEVVPMNTSLIPFHVNGVSPHGTFFVFWFNNWDHKSHKAETCIFGNVFNNSAICLHPMDMALRPSEGVGRLYALSRDQNDEVRQFVDAVFHCKGVKLERYLFMDSSCIKTSRKGESNWRMILGTTEGAHPETWLAVVYGSQGDFKGMQYLSNKYTGKMKWEASASSIHVMSLTCGYKPDAARMMYHEYKTSTNCNGDHHQPQKCRHGDHDVTGAAREPAAAPEMSRIKEDVTKLKKEMEDSMTEIEKIQKEVDDTDNPKE